VSAAPHDRQAHAEVSKIIDSPEGHAMAEALGPRFIEMMRQLMVLSWTRGYTVGKQQADGEEK
jgi:hypothetical protein